MIKVGQVWVVNDEKSDDNGEPVRIVDISTKWVTFEWFNKCNKLEEDACEIDEFLRDFKFALGEINDADFVKWCLLKEVPAPAVDNLLTGKLVIQNTKKPFVDNKCVNCGKTDTFAHNGLCQICLFQKNQKEKQGKKYDTDKPRMSLVPMDVLWQVIAVLEFGAKRYGNDNWQKVDNARTRYFDACHRHLQAWWGGERVDSDSGLPHLAHAVCCLLFLMWFDGDQE